MLSEIEHLARQCHRRWIPKWYHAFARTDGLFHERLDHQFLPISTGRLRLLTQCRQLAIYAHASVAGRTVVPPAQLTAHYDAIMRQFYNDASGGWIFAIADGDEGNQQTVIYDLYAHAFVIFMCVWMHHATGEERFHHDAVQARRFLTDKFRAKQGFYEQLNADLKPIPQIRRQDPHMHLLEAALFAYEVWGSKEDAALAHELVDLFQHVFWDAERQCLGEDYDDELAPHPTQGDYCEPGHHFEWVWLLHRYAHAFQDTQALFAIRQSLLNFGNTYGYDPVHGGLYNAVSRSGQVLEADKRIWPLTEALKANAIMLDHTNDRNVMKALMRDTTGVLSSGYVHKRGFWTETLHQDLSPQTDYMPGTTPYHLYFGIIEALDVLKARGPSKSWRSVLIGAGYWARRRISTLFKTVWNAGFSRS